jgi:hypothetical protein
VLAEFQALPDKAGPSPPPPTHALSSGAEVGPLTAACTAGARATWSFNGLTSASTLSTTTGAGIMTVLNDGQPAPGVTLDTSVFDTRDTAPIPQQSLRVANWTVPASGGFRVTAVRANSPTPVAAPNICCTLRYRCNSLTNATWQVFVAWQVPGNTITTPLGLRQLCNTTDALGWRDLYWTFRGDPVALAGSTQVTCGLQYSDLDLARSATLGVPLNIDMLSIGGIPAPVPGESLGGRVSWSVCVCGGGSARACTCLGKQRGAAMPTC